MRWFKIKWLEDRKKRKQEEIELLRSIANSLKELEGSIDRSHRYGNAIKTTPAVRH